MRSRQEIEHGLRAILASRLEGHPDPASLPDGVPVFHHGLGLDSFSAVELLLEIERVYEVYIDDDAFDVFDSLRKLTDYVHAHQSGTS